MQHTADVTRQINVQRFVFYSDMVTRNDFFSDSLFKKYVQCSGDLGARLEYAFSIPFKDEYKRAVVIGGDCLTIKPEHINTAFEKLNDHDFVIGPATDGGYYLLGMKKWNRSLFKNKSWSTPSVFEETKNEIINNNGRLFLLEQLSDVDEFNDLKNYPELI